MAGIALSRQIARRVSPSASRRQIFAANASVKSGGRPIFRFLGAGVFFVIMPPPGSAARIAPYRRHLSQTPRAGGRAVVAGVCFRIDFVRFTSSSRHSWG